MEHTIREPLHLDSESFRDLLQASSEDLKIPVQLIEKDYYISAILRALSKSTYSRQIVFKGGTSLSKAFQLIDRFSEDVDFAVISGDMSGNQVKMLLSKLMKEVTVGILNWYDHRISNGVVEGINNKIKVLKWVADGYRNMDYFQLRLFALHDQVITQNLG